MHFQIRKKTKSTQPPRFSMLSLLNWSVASAFALIQFLLQASTGLMASSWQHEFSLNATEVGYLSAAFYFSYVLMQIPVGLMYDRFGARKILTTAALLMFLGTLGLGLSGSYLQAFLARIVMGIGSSFGFVGMLHVTSSWFSRKHFAVLVGISETIAMLGVAFGELAMAWIISHYGWRKLTFIASVGIFVITILSALIIRENPAAQSQSAEKKPAKGFVESICIILSNKYVWTTGIYGFALFSIISVFVTLWGVPFFTHTRGYSLHAASIMMSMIFVGTAVGAPGVGWILGRFPIKQWVMSGFAALSAILFAIVLHVPQLPKPLTMLLLLLIGFFSASYIQVFAIIRDIFSPGLRATALGTANMIFMISAPLMQPVIGKVLSLHYSYPTALSLLVVLLMAAFFISFHILPKEIQDISVLDLEEKELKKL